MTSKGAEGAVLTSALVVASVWGYRKLIEPASSEAAKSAGSSSAIARVIGAEPTPAGAAQFAVAFGFSFMTLAVFSTFAPDLAGSVAILFAVGDVIANGASVFSDVSEQVTETTKAPKPAAVKK
jgi:hypothetical protein